MSPELRHGKLQMTALVHSLIIYSIVIIFCSRTILSNSTTFCPKFIRFNPSQNLHPYTPNCVLPVP